MAKIGDVLFKGQSGQSYKFTVYTYDQAFKRVPAVYAVARRSKTHTGGYKDSVIYIGQTSVLPERFVDHDDEACFKQNRANCIWIHLDADFKSRLQKERDLLAAHRPPCNG